MPSPPLPGIAVNQPVWWMSPMPTRTADPARPWIACAGARLLADPSGALVWPDRELLLVADLHFEKGSSFARRGQLLPPYDTRSTLDRLEAAICRHRPRRVISLGDGFHDIEASGRLESCDRDRLKALVGAHDWIWILGNHDPGPPLGLGGTVEQAVEVDGIILRHTPEPRPHDCAGNGEPAEIAGHLHPTVRIKVRGRGLARPCFVSDRTRVLLPAFGSFTGGLDVRHPAIAGLFAAAPAIRMLGRDTVYLVASGVAGKKKGGPKAASK